MALSSYFHVHIAGRSDATLLDVLAADPRHTRIEPVFKIIVLVSSASFHTQSLAAVLDALRSASYDTDSIALEIILAPCSDTRLSDARFDLCRRLDWPHGSKVLRNATSGGYFDLILDAWIPAHGENTPALIVEVPRAKPPSKNFYRYLKSVRKRYMSRSADFAGFAIHPVPVRRRIVTETSSDKKNQRYMVTNENRFIGYKDNEAGVFLYQVLPQTVGIFAPLDAGLWRSFRIWFAGHRQEWFLWPVVVNAKDKKNPMWSQFTGTTRAHWSHWFSRFSAEHRLYTLYPRLDPPEPLPDVGKASPMDALRMYDFKGDAVSISTSISVESLRRIVELGAQGDGFISMTVVNKAFVATARSWICNVDEAGFRPPGVVWIVTDTESRDALQTIPGSETVYLEEFRGGNETTGTSYGTPGYWLLMLERTRLIREILDRGIGIFAFETDQIWLRDPVPHVKRLIDNGDEVDVVGTMDSRHEIGGNFLFLSPTMATKRLWREVSTRFEKAFYALKMHKRTSLRHHYMENDQSLLTKLIFFDESFKHRNPVVFRALDTELFVDGRWYEYPRAKVYSSKRSRSPVLINNNFLIGIEAKRKRALSNGHWFVESDNKTCIPSAVRTAVAENNARGLGLWMIYPASVGDIEVSLDDALSAIAVEQHR